MAGTPLQKQKTLILLRILCEHTDASHPMTLAELAEELSRRGISSERKSLYRDLKAISDAGFSIGTIRSKDTRYYWNGFPFSRRDYLLLSNLLRIAPIIPRKRKPDLLGKLRETAPHPQKRESFADVFSIIPESTVTERVYSNVELLLDAITAGVKVSFTYKERTLSVSSAGKKSHHYTVSPYRLVWNDGYFLAAADGEGSLVFYRPEKMEGLRLTSSPSEDIREVGGDLDFDLIQYIKGYFASLEDPVHMIFRVSEAFLSTAERYFPSDSLIESTVDGSCLITCDMPANESLFGWLLFHSDDVRILYPEALVQRLRRISLSAANIYNGDVTAESGINFEENGNTVDKLKKIRYNVE